MFSSLFPRQDHQLQRVDTHIHTNAHIIPASPGDCSSKKLWEKTQVSRLKVTPQFLEERLIYCNCFREWEWLTNKLTFLKHFSRLLMTSSSSLIMLLWKWADRRQWKEMCLTGRQKDDVLQRVEPLTGPLVEFMFYSDVSFGLRIV